MFRNLSKKKWIGIILVVSLIALLPVSAVHAADFSHDGTVEAAEVIDDDVFLSADQCEMNGTINGNLVAACQHITINGSVSGDAFLFAETVTVGESATVEGNLFAFGADVELDGKVSGSVASAAESVLLNSHASVGRNLYFAGYQSKLEEGSTVGMDVFGGANQIIANGTVARDLSAGTNALELRGAIGRNASIELGTGSSDMNASISSQMPSYYPAALPAGIRFYEGASVGNDLTYTATENIDTEVQDYVQGTVTFKPATAESSKGHAFSRSAWSTDDFSHFRVAGAFSQMLSYYALGALAFWLAKKQIVKVKDAGKAFPGKAFGWGFLVILIGMLSIVLVPGTFILLGILVGVVSMGGLLFAWYGVIGLAIALAFALFLLVVFSLSKVVAAYVFGEWLMQDVLKTKMQNRWIDLLVGLLFYVILCAIPYFGWVVGLAASLYGTGTLFIALTHVEKKREPKILEEK
ncbi:MAG: hypothetical protein GYA45_01350 [Pelolinea sp.]|jgi:cytoskeletal protein CcmA (bactofilin family)/uncharacterized Tic20 family protein|nr:hypothetical protein [Pelolinea sp.]